MKERKADQKVSLLRTKLPTLITIALMVALLLLLNYNTTSWRIISQKTLSASECRVEIQDNSFQVMLRSLPLTLDSIRINLSRDSVSSDVTIVDCQRDMRIIGEPDRTTYAEVRVFAPQIQSTTFTLHKKL